MNSLGTTLADLFAHNCWANEKIAHLCAGLSIDQLGAELPIGMGTFRAIYWHICGAEEVWLVRWQGVAIDASSFREVRSVEETTERLQAVDRSLQKFLAGRSDEELRGVISYRNFAGSEFSESLAALALHVANHGVHHRAQLLQFLKQQNRCVPGGLDYIFYKITAPTVAIPPDVANRIRTYGLTVGETVTPDQPVHRRVLEVHQAYGTWMINRLFDAASGLSDADLDRDFQMGPGTFRKTLTHLLDAENCWLENYSGDVKPFPQSSVTHSIPELRQGWQSMCTRRTSYLAGLRDSQLSDLVGANFGAGTIHFRIGESMLQLALHGTHHRAQAINMLRRFGINIGPTDLVVFLRMPETTGM